MLFGAFTHKIKRTPQPNGLNAWAMQERLAGAMPCEKHRHTGEHVAEMTDLMLGEVAITDPISQTFACKSDCGSYMIKGWKEFDLVPCADHVWETDVKAYYDHPPFANNMSKGRGQVGYLHSSTIGRSGFHECQTQLGLSDSLPPQDVATRWRSGHDLTSGLRQS